VYAYKKGIRPGKVEERAYQLNIAAEASKRSTLVVLPTGMGKTIVALLVMADILSRKKGKVLFMAPTKPLVEQHASFIRDMLEDFGGVEVFTGEVSPEKRGALWGSSRIVCSTPQVVANDLVAGRIDLSGVDLMVVDEAHRAVGDYAYVFVGEKYRDRPGGLVLAATASPGSDVAKILEVCGNLNIEHVEIRSKYDADVLQYVHDIDVEWKVVELSGEMKDIISLMKDVLGDYVKELKGFGIVLHQPVSTKLLLEAGRRIQGQIGSNPGSKSFYRAASVHAAAVKLNHGIELAETQGPRVLRAYLAKLREESGSRQGSRASRMLASNRKMQDVLRVLDGMTEEHPKVDVALGVVRKGLASNPDARIIMFTHYRETAEMMTEKLGDVEGARPMRFVGQASKGEDKGLRQKAQVQAVQDFRDGVYNVLVATSVAEEGLDIPSTDLVVFYEPVPSEIRTIQRRGRTGRKRRGRVVVLMARGTRDQGYYFSSNRKEKLMQEELQRLRRDLAKKLSVGDIYRQRVEGVHVLEGDGDVGVVKRQRDGRGADMGQPKRGGNDSRGQKSLMEFSENPEEGGTSIGGKPVIVVDGRELSSSVVRELSRLGAVVESRHLQAGDFVVSPTMGVERKDVKDFLSSLMDGRLFSQMADMTRSYMEPVLVIEGSGLTVRKNISHAAVYGAIASIISDFRITVLATGDTKETARLLFALASRRSRDSKGRRAQRHGKPGVSRLRESQLYVIEGLPGVSAAIARRLLDHFGSVHGVFSASEEELLQVKGVGSKTAENIVRVLHSEFR